MSTPIFAQFPSARRAIRQQARGYALRRGASAGIVVLVIAVALWSRWPQIAPWVLLPVLLAWLTYAGWPLWRVRPILRDDRTLARWLETCRPHYRNDLSALLEFEDRPPETSSAAKLRARTRARMQETLRAESASWDDVLFFDKTTRERRLAWMWIALAVLCMLTPWFRQTRSPAPSKAEATDVAEDLPSVLVIRAIDVHVEPPEYTGIPAQTLSSVTGGVRVQEGSRITLSGQLYQQVDRGWIEAKHDDERTAMRIDDGFFFEVEYVATQDDTLRFGFETRGNAMRDRATFELQVRTDETPVVTLYDPEDDVRVTPGEVVELQYDVSDDFGLRDVHLVWHFADQEDDAQRILLLDEASGTFAEDTAPFDTAPLYMQPGDEVVVYLEARDNVSFRPANVGTSRVLTLFVEEEEDFLDDLLALKEQAFESSLKQLGGALPAPWIEIAPDDAKGFVLERAALNEDTNLTDDLEAFATSISKDGHAVRTDLERIVTLLHEMEHADAREVRLFDSMASGLERIYTRLESAVADQSEAIEKNEVFPSHLSVIAPLSIDLVEDLERAALLLSSLISEHKAQDVARALEELSDIRSRLRELLEEYKETNNPETRARIERELTRLSRRMDELMQKLSSQVENLPQEHFNAEGLEQSEVQEQVSTMQDAMDRLRESMASSDPDAAMRAFEELSQNLDALYQEFGDPTLNADEDTLSEFDRAMGEISDEIDAVEHMQRAVEEETARMEQELREEKLHQHRQALEEQLQRAQKIVEQAQEHIAQADDPQDKASLDQALRAAERSLESLEQILEQRAFSDAEDGALDAMNALQKLRDESAKQQRYSTDKEERSALKSLEKSSKSDAAEMKALAEEFSRWQQRLAPDAGDERSEQLQSLQERQEATQQQLQSLQQKMEDVGEQFPTMKPDDEGSGMQRAHDGMQQSSESLQKGQAQRAHQGQNQALESLQHMRQNMQQRMAQHRQQLQQQAQQQGRGSPKTENVDLSKENARDLRQREQIMDAMREGRLEAWDDPIRQYYESLVR